MIKRLFQIIAAFITGIVGVVFGVGSGIIMIPTLLFTGIKTKKTAGTSLAIITFITLSGTLQHFHMKTFVTSPDNMFLLGAGMLGAIIGSLFLNAIKNKVLTFLILTYFYIIGVAMIVNPIFINAEFIYQLPPEAFWITGLFVGIISSALGIGAGAILAPIMIFVFETPAKEAIGIVMPFMFLLSFSSTIINVKNRLIDYGSFAFAMPAAVAGTLLAYIYFNRIDDIQIQIGIGILLLINAISITTRSISKNS